MKFKCPQCHAEVTREAQDPIGCPCCGYATQGVAPYSPFITWPAPNQTIPFETTPQWWVNPNAPPKWYVGDYIPSPCWTVSEGTSNIRLDMKASTGTVSANNLPLGTQVTYTN